MRRVVNTLLFVLAVLGASAPSVLAGPNAGGTLIVHYPSLAYTSDTTTYCGISPLSSCTSAVSRIDGSSKTAVKVWKVYAAFVTGSSPRLAGLTWGVNYTSVTIGAGSTPAGYYGKCADTEIPDTGWPAAGTSDGVFWNTPMTTTLVEVYWFAGYASGGSGTFTLGPDPSLGGNFTDDSVPPNVDPIYAYGTMGFGIAGNDPCPAVVGACCLPNGTCIAYTPGDCAAHGGTYLGDNTSCVPNPCPQVMGACCLTDGTCTMTLQGACQGIWQGPNTFCAPNPCPQPQGACCMNDSTCQLLTYTACIGEGGTWQGPNTTCTPNPCTGPTGACCLCGNCTMTTQADCAGNWLGSNSTCSPNPCDQKARSRGRMLARRQGAARSAGKGLGGITPFLRNRAAKATVSAGPNAGGTLIVHNPDLAYTSDTSDYCGALPLSSCANAVSEIDGSGPDAIKVWKVYAAFPSGSSPRLKGVSFGVTYPGNVRVACQGYGSCADQDFPDDAWPGSGSGDAVIWDSAQTTILVECYWFAGYVSGGSGTCTLGPNPTLGGNFTDDAVPPNVDPIAAYGAMGFEIGGTDPCPGPGGACCFPDGTCIIYTARVCAAEGGSYQGDNTTCRPNPCPANVGACCTCGTCTMTTQAGCTGYWLGQNSTCSPNPCQPKARFKGRALARGGNLLARGGMAARSVGSGIGRVKAGPRVNPCPGSDLLMNADGSYEDGYTWWYGGEVAPYYGAFAEGYNASGTVCGQQYALTALTGMYVGQRLDAYLWSSDGCVPASVIRVDMGISISAPGIWPAVTLHDVNTSDEPVNGDFFIGYWGEWPGAAAGWFVGADLDGVGGKPRTNIAPGIGYPTGWADPSIVWGPIQALGIAAYVMSKNPVTGACCFADGSCTALTQYTCQHEGGAWDGSGTVCVPNPCPQPPVGACCINGVCTITTEANCSGQWMGANTVCTPNPCPMDGACCINGHSTITTQTNCQGQWMGPNTICNPNPCPPVGACCINGACTITTQANCQGQWMGANTVCIPNPCPPATGACCISGVCTITIQANCQGQWMGPGTTCNPNPCTQPMGACCICGHCAITTQADCQGQWMGEGTTCNPNPCPIAKRYTKAGRSHGGPAAGSVSVGHGVIRPGSRTNPCPGSALFLNADGSYENGYTWWYGGQIAPYYGAFAEGYEVTGTICGQQYALTTSTGMFNCQKLDAYLWNSDGNNPTSVIHVDAGVSIDQPAIWPSISLADINTTDEPVRGNFFVGYWGEWQGAMAGWFIGADVDGFGGMPRTNIAPGIGYPTGWNNVSLIWGPTQAVGIGAYILMGPPPPVPVSIQTWGRIKSLYH